MTAGSADLASAAADAGILLDFPCAGTAACGRCRVRVSGAVPSPTQADLDVLTRADLDAGWRLGCRLVVDADAAVEVGAVPRLAVTKDFGQADALDPARERLAAPRGSGSAPRGLAVDLGTTSLAAAIVGLDSGAVLASATRLNPQASFGADVMTRIHRATESADAARAMRDGVRGALATMADALATASGTTAAEIAAVTVVGNPAMIHLWLGLDVSPLARAPFDGRLSGSLTMRASSAGIPASPDAEVYVLPGLRNHVGADAVGAAVAMDLDRCAAPTLLIDLGTNSEIVLAGSQGLLAASAAAGPAFEGAGLSCGMRAADGAIDALWIRDDGAVVARVIGEGAAAGLCGSGAMDAIAELLRWGVIDRRGRLRSAADLSGRLPDALRDRVIETAGGRAVALDTPAEGRITLTALDIRQIQLAAAAMRAGVGALLREAGVTAEGLDRVLVAGAFGRVVRASSLTRLGLVPVADPRRVRVVGNAAGAGARLALLDVRLRRRAETLAATARHVDLARVRGYAEMFAQALMFPERDRS